MSGKPIVINVVGSLVILAAGVYCFQIFGEKPDVPTRETKDADQAVLVRTAIVESYERPLELQVDGEASTYRVVTVGAEVAGQILEKPDNIRGGLFVEQNQLLFRIDALDFELDVERIQAQLDQVIEETAAIEIDLTNTTALIALGQEDLQLRRNELNRKKKLIEGNATTESQLDEALRQELAARNSLQSLENQHRSLTQQKKTKQATIKLYAAQLRRAELDVERCDVRAPISGRLVDDLVEEGDYVKLGDDLVHISDGSRMEIACSLQSDQLAWIWQQQVAQQQGAQQQGAQQQGAQQQGAESASAAAPHDPIHLAPVPCEVVFEFQGVETIWDGQLTRFEGTGIDRDTRMFPCRVLVERPDEPRTNRSAGGRPAATPPTLLSGMYVTVRIPVESAVPLLQVPLEAVRPGGELWVVRDGRLQVALVSVAKANPHTAIIRRDDSGVTVGDRVIVSPLAAIADGMPVREQMDVALQGNAPPDLLPETAISEEVAQ